jgi:hypothetical protein
MLKLFLLGLFSSWLATPVGILVAQGFGVANSPVVLLVLLATGACVPFQLLMNECVAATESRGEARACRSLIATLLFAQFTTCAATIYYLSTQQYSSVLVVGVAACLVVSTGLSYKASLYYYRLASEAVLSPHAAVVTGIIPGLSNIVLFLSYSILAGYLPWAASAFVIATTLLPAVIQWQYLKRLSDRLIDTKPFTLDALPVLSNRWLLGAVIALAVLSVGSTWTRESVANLSVSHAGLLLVALNSMLGLINTFTRVAFLRRRRVGQQRALAVAAVSMAGVATIGTLMGWALVTLIVFVTTQLSTALVIEIARRMPYSPCVVRRL